MVGTQVLSRVVSSLPKQIDSPYVFYLILNNLKSSHHAEASSVVERSRELTAEDFLACVLRQEQLIEASM